jgi:hypothetical protein
MKLPRVIEDIADILVAIDGSGIPFKQFQPGVGPYGEPQLVHVIAEKLDSLPEYHGLVKSKRTPDLLISGHWGIEFKLAHPFGDNGKQAEDWSVNLLHPYEGNVSVIGDCLKLERWSGSEKRASVVIGYEHTPPQISLEPLLRALEAVAKTIPLNLSKRIETSRANLKHPIHQQLIVIAWEVLPRLPATGF